MKDRANVLLQYLVGELNKLWTGQPSEIKTTEEIEDADDGKPI